MTQYLQFAVGDPDGSVVLVEVDQMEVTPSAGVVKAGLKEKLETTVATAQTTLTTAIKGAIQANVQAFIEAVNELPEPPTEVEIAFGLKATGEVGNIAIGKMGSEVNYTVKLAWKRESRV